MPDVRRFAQFKQLAGRLPGRADDRVLPADGEQAADCLLPRQGIAVAVDPASVVGQRTLAHDESDLFSRRKQFPKAVHRLPQLLHGRFLPDDETGNVQRFEQADRHFPLKTVLRLVRHARLPPPADDEHARHGIDGPVQQGGERIDRVPLPAVLQVDQRDLAGRKVVTGGERDAVSLVRSDQVPPRVLPVGIQQVIAERAKQGIRHAGIESRSHNL